MTRTEAIALVEFRKHALALAKFEAKPRLTYDQLMTATRLMEVMAAIRDRASPFVRRRLRKVYGWQ